MALSLSEVGIIDPKLEGATFRVVADDRLEEERHRGVLYLVDLAGVKDAVLLTIDEVAQYAPTIHEAFGQRVGELTSEDIAEGFTPTAIAAEIENGLIGSGVSEDIISWSQLQPDRLRYAEGSLQALHKTLCDYTFGQGSLAWVQQNILNFIRPMDDKFLALKLVKKAIAELPTECPWGASVVVSEELFLSEVFEWYPDLAEHFYDSSAAAMAAQ